MTFEKLINELKNEGLRVTNKTTFIRVSGQSGAFRYVDIHMNEWDNLDENGKRATVSAIVRAFK